MLNGATDAPSWIVIASGRQLPYGYDRPDCCMLSRLRNLLELNWWGSPDAPWYGSLGFSVVFHLSMIALFAGLWVDRNRQSDSVRVETQWSNRDVEPLPPDVEIERPERDRHTTLPQSAAAGGREIGPKLNLSEPRPTLTVRPPGRFSGQSASLTDVLADVDPLQEVGDFSGGSGKAGHGGKGDGEGTSEGNGAGSGFFGVETTGQSVVFVVDCSASMNHPHDSEAKTRFGKLKLELIRAISRMDASMSFFIIFFNDKSIPMPADRMQPASESVQRQYLEWTVGVRAKGQTDPRASILEALRLQPDVIFFLTDGNFEAPIRRDLKKLSQRRVAIHTIAFGNRVGEKALQEFAAANGGQYRFIP